VRDDADGKRGVVAHSKSKRVVESPSVSDDDSDDDPAATQRAMDAELLDENGKPKSLSKVTPPCALRSSVSP
jgi:hypothetical protein